MIVNIRYNLNIAFSENMKEHISIINSCGIPCNEAYYLGGGSHTGLKWNVGDDRAKINFLLLKTGGTIR